MIHYHGLPISGKKIESASFLAARHVLVSFEYPGDLEIAAELSQSFCLDNGAFSKWRSGRGDVDVGAYHAWVHRFAKHPGLDFCLIPDVIDGDEDRNAELVNNWIREGSEVNSCPVWHLHESLEYLRYLISNFKIVAFGSSGDYATPGTEQWHRRMDEAMVIACDPCGRPRRWLHGLRMLDPEIFTRYPFRSADSTNCAVNAGSVARFGSYVPADAGLRATVIASRIEAFNSPYRYEFCPQTRMEL